MSARRRLLLALVVVAAVLLVVAAVVSRFGWSLVSAVIVAMVWSASLGAVAIIGFIAGDGPVVARLIPGRRR